MSRRSTLGVLSRRAVSAAVLLLVVGGLAPATAEATPTQQPLYRVLVFTKAAGFVHSSIPNAVDAIETLGDTHRFEADVTNDAASFTDANLARYAAVVFVHTTGNVLPGAGERAAFERYIRQGGGFFGVHAAADMGADVASGWPFYRDLVGAAFKGHTNVRVWGPWDLGFGTIYEGPVWEAPPESEPFLIWRLSTSEPALVVVEDIDSAATRGWGSSVTRSDEWYGFLTNPRPSVHVLASLDESSYDPGAGDMGPGAADHPIFWCQRYQGGRSVYNAMGHPATAWSDPTFLESVLGSIRMAAGHATFDCP
jgi:cytochrome c